MRKPVVGVIANTYRIENRFDIQSVGERNLRAVADVAGALPLVFPGLPDVTDIAYHRHGLRRRDVVAGLGVSFGRELVHVERRGELAGGRPDREPPAHAPTAPTAARAAP